MTGQHIIHCSRCYGGQGRAVWLVRTPGYRSEVVCNEHREVSVRWCTKPAHRGQPAREPEIEAIGDEPQALF